MNITKSPSSSGMTGLRGVRGNVTSAHRMSKVTASTSKASLVSANELGNGLTKSTSGNQLVAKSGSSSSLAAKKAIPVSRVDEAADVFDEEDELFEDEVDVPLPGDKENGNGAEQPRDKNEAEGLAKDDLMKQSLDVDGVNGVNGNLEGTLSGQISGPGDKRKGEGEKAKNREKEVFVERTVIDEPLIVESVREERRAHAEVDPYSPFDLTQPVLFTQVDVLLLSFRNIQKIENLQGLESLVKLQLDNNVIDAIEGLEHLVNLQWLDLSFNNIRKIEGLEKLTKLTDLSLFDNRIERIENLEKLTELQVLSLGNNEIRSLEGVKSLRCLRKLRLLNMRGNPVCDEDEFRATVLACLPSLKYVDYELIDGAQVQKARDRLRDSIVEVEAQEKTAKQAEVDQVKKQHEDEVARAANLVGVRDLGEVMQRDDAEGARLRALPGHAKLIEDFRQVFDKTLQEYVASSMEKYGERKDEHRLFTDSMNAVTKSNEEQCTALINDFDHKKKQRFQAFRRSVTLGRPELSLLEALKMDLVKLSDDLMELECLLVEQSNSLASEFEDAYKLKVDSNTNRTQSIFKILEDHAKAYGTAVNDLCNQLLIKYQNDELAECTDAMDALLCDKDTLINLVATSNDNMVHRINTKSDDLCEQEDREFKKTIREIRANNYQRNRSRVAEIATHTEMIQSQIEREEQTAKSSKASSNP